MQGLLPGQAFAVGPGVVRQDALLPVDAVAGEERGGPRQEPCAGGGLPVVVDLPVGRAGVVVHGGVDRRSRIPCRCGWRGRPGGRAAHLCSQAASPADVSLSGKPPPPGSLPYLSAYHRYPRALHHVRRHPRLRPSRPTSPSCCRLASCWSLLPLHVGHQGASYTRRRSLVRRGPRAARACHVRRIACPLFCVTCASRLPWRQRAQAGVVCATGPAKLWNKALRW